MKNSSTVFFLENSVNGAGREKTEEKNKEEKIFRNKEEKIFREETNRTERTKTERRSKPVCIQVDNTGNLLKQF